VRHAGNQQTCHFVVFLGLSQLVLLCDVSESHDVALGLVKEQMLFGYLDCFDGGGVFEHFNVNDVFVVKESRISEQFE
jgi:hypothetical protein